MPKLRFASPFSFAALVCVLFLLTQGTHLHALGQQSEDPRARAFRLFDESKLIEALPLLEKLSIDYPNDAAVFEKLGFALLAKIQLSKDEGERRALINRAGEAMLHSRQLGNDSNLLKAGLENIAALAASGGNKPKFSTNASAEAAMNEGEQAYVNGNLDQAAAAYQRALKFDPQLYEAALFTGDMFFKKDDWDRAGEWFAKAIQLDPNRETAYRYWGDSLMMGQNKREESRQKFAEAIVAEPYNRRAWTGLMQWGEHYGVELAHPLIQPSSGVSDLKDNKMTITIDPKALDKTDDGTSAWMVYGLTRAAWATSKFAKEYPNEKYRHSLREEAEALRRVAEVVKQQVKDGKVKKLDAMIERLVKLYDDDMIEAFVLFVKANEGIAQDYGAYRNANRDKLRRYLMDYVSSGN